VYRDAGISGSKGRDQRPGFDAMHKDAARRRFDVVMAWSVDRLCFQMMGVFAEFERSMIVERVRAGVATGEDWSR
jgi:DNA invertase Pin-like site-specific DNA recombinase